MSAQQYQLPQLQQPPQQPTGELLNTSPTPQMPPDKTTASLTMPANQAMTNLGFANNMLHHLIQFKGSQSGKQNAQPAQELQPKEPPKEVTPAPASTDNPDAKIHELEANFTKQIADLKQEMKDEISSINKSITDALSNEQG